MEGLTDEQIRRQIIPGKWSIFENIVHLQTYQHTFIGRIRAILRGDHPRFDRYTAEADPLFLDQCSKSTREIISDLLTIRKELSSSISQLPPHDLDKYGSHPAYGNLNLVEWLHFFLLHEAHHLFTIFKLAGALKNNQ